MYRIIKVHGRTIKVPNIIRRVQHQQIQRIIKPSQPIPSVASVPNPPKLSNPSNPSSLPNRVTDCHLNQKVQNVSSQQNQPIQNNQIDSKYPLPSNVRNTVPRKQLDVKRSSHLDVKHTQSQTSQLQDVHQYDGKISYRCPRVEIPDMDKLYLFERSAQIVNLSTRQDKPVALRWLKQIKDDTRKPSNYDSSNDQYADDLLLHIAQRASPAIADYLCEQLAEISNGPCPQGRCTRLYQIYNALI